MIEDVPSRVAAIVLNYRTPDDTIRAVRSLERSSCAPEHLIVVDNGSNDGSVTRLTSELGAVILMAADTNSGFSAGTNLGIRKACDLGADRILLLNSDATIDPDTIANLSQVLAEDPNLGIVGPVVVSADDPDRVESLGISYGLRTGRMKQLGSGRSRGRLGSAGPWSVDAVSGCAMLVRREVFERVGLFGRRILLQLRGRGFLPSRSRGRVSHGLCRSGARSTSRQRVHRTKVAAANLLRHAQSPAARQSCVGDAQPVPEGRNRRGHRRAQPGSHAPDSRRATAPRRSSSRPRTAGSPGWPIWRARAARAISPRMTSNWSARRSLPRRAQPRRTGASRPRGIECPPGTRRGCRRAGDLDAVDDDTDLRHADVVGRRDGDVESPDPQVHANERDGGGSAVHRRGWRGGGGGGGGGGAATLPIVTSFSARIATLPASSVARRVIRCGPFAYRVVSSP